jgi:hypothetical protein
MVKQVFLSLLSVVVFALGSWAQHPSDAAVLPYEVNEIYTSISDAFENPTDENAYAQFLITEDGFPVISVGSMLSQVQTTELERWIATNPDKIEKFLIARKKIMTP